MEASITLATDNSVKKLKKSFASEPDESEFWREVSEVLLHAPIPSTMTVEYQGERAILDIGERGSFYRNGQKLPSMCVTPRENGIVLPPAKYDEAYLTCVNPETDGGRGNYKFYHLIPTAAGIEVEYGRIGIHSGWGGPRKVSTPYPTWMFWVKHAEKRSKDYRDQSALYLAPTEEAGKEEAEPEPVTPDTDDALLYELLLGFARGRVRSSLLAGENVTSAMVKASYELIEKLKCCTDVEEFNGLVRELMAVCPRTVGYVSDNLARSTSDFQRIILSEESLAAAMDAVVAAKTNRKVKPELTGTFALFGIGIRKASPEEIADDVSPNLSTRLNRYVKDVWVVEPAGQRERFEARCARRGIGADGRRLLWHGSRNENWCSIIQKSLMLNPDAVRTGSMFGNGLYFSMEGSAGRGEKSFNYTSWRGSHWANGNQDVAFMALFECAYGKPNKVQSTGWYTQADMDRLDCDCVHAFAKPGFLYNEEIVFYAEDAVCMKYLVEFAA